MSGVRPDRVPRQGREPGDAGRPAPRGRRSRREANAVFAIAWREVLRAVKSPLSIAFTVIFPILFIGVLGGSIAQNLGGALPYAYLPFMLIGMIANTMYQGTISGRHQPRRGARERLHRRALRGADLALRGAARQADRLGRRGAVLARRGHRDDRRDADPDGLRATCSGSSRWPRSSPSPAARSASSSSGSPRTRRSSRSASRC